MDSLSTDITDVNVSFVASPIVKKRQEPEQMSLWLVNSLYASWHGTSFNTYTVMSIHVAFG